MKEILDKLNGLISKKNDLKKELEDTESTIYQLQKEAAKMFHTAKRPVMYKQYRSFPIWSVDNKVVILAASNEGAIEVYPEELTLMTEHDDSPILNDSNYPSYVYVFYCSDRVCGTYYRYTSCMHAIYDHIQEYDYDRNRVRYKVLNTIT